MRVAIVGAGAIGTYLASRLHHAGHAITVVARPVQTDALTRSGIHLHIGDTAVMDHVAVVDHLTSSVDLVLMTVKTQDLEDACHAISSAAHNATIVTLQNGVRADDIAASHLGREPIVGGVATCAVTCFRPGVARVEIPGWFIVGDPWQRSNARIPAVAEAIGQVAPTFVTPDLPSARWTKLIGNLTNGVSAATGLSLAELGRTHLGRMLILKILREGHRVLRASGIRLEHRLYASHRGDRRTALVAVLQSLVSTLVPRLPEWTSNGLLALAARTRLGRTDFRGSTWQSLARGRSTEIDYLNGEIVRMGSSVCVPTPYNSRVVQAVHTAEAVNQFFTVADLCPNAR